MSPMHSWTRKCVLLPRPACIRNLGKSVVTVDLFQLSAMSSVHVWTSVVAEVFSACDWLALTHLDADMILVHWFHAQQ